jgi:polyisoprenyl-phosphate glycosyltransferase
MRSGARSGHYCSGALQMKVSFVIPVYHNEGSIAKTHDAIQSTLKASCPELDYEMIFVDDGSTDGSLNEIMTVKEADACVRVITFTRNFGQLSAMLAGFKESTGDAVINISADLQDPVELIPEMVRLWQSGSEIVIGHRTDRTDPFLAKLFSKIAYGILRFSIPQMPRGGFDFVLMDRKAMDTFNSVDVRHRFFQGDVLWAGYKTSFIPYVRQKRTVGKSQYNFAKKLKIFIDDVLDASYLPIRLISLLGLITSALGLIYCIMIFIAWLRGDTPFSGWAPIMIVTLVVGGLIMVMLGIIGEYIWRINEEVRKRPNYVVRDRIP